MSDFAPPPAPDGTPAGSVKRADFRAAPPAPRRSRFPRWLTVLLGLAGAVIVVAVAAQITLTVRNGNLSPAEPGATGRLHSAQVVSGMCIASLGDGAGPVTVVDCDEPHSAEVVSSYSAQGDEWPGADEIASTVLQYCASQLMPGGELAHAAEGRDWVAWVPSQATWEHGDRAGLCIVTAAEPWTGSAKDQSAS
ncbi:septum formation family protein [Demequina sp.]|uniref:septum formation family protein n=1 Tax=Demequina sp. TaxID=2050685 RepID=UPI003D103C24